jgi:hypothetical protein
LLVPEVQYVDDEGKRPIDEKKVRFKRNIISSKSSNTRWIIIITIVSFFLSTVLSFLSTEILEGVNLIFALLLVLFIILIGIIFDMIGIAVTAADEVPFHAMASRKHYAAKQSIKLIRNANKVSSICNDVIGDICGIISGAASGMIIISIFRSSDSLTSVIGGLCITGLVASLMVGGKALGKTFAIENSNFIVHKVSLVLQFFNLRRETIKAKR